VLQVEIVPSAHKIEVFVDTTVVGRKLQGRVMGRMLVSISSLATPVFLKEETTATLRLGRLALGPGSMIESGGTKAPITTPIVGSSLRTKELPGLEVTALVSQFSPLVNVG
jgi:hypothetical protein